jgi:membrane protein
VECQFRRQIPVRCAQHELSRARKTQFFRRTLISFGFTLGITGFVAIALCAVVAVPIILNFIGLESVSKLMFSILRWPFMLIVIMIGLSFVYRYGPSRNPAHWQWVS